MGWEECFIRLSSQYFFAPPSFQEVLESRHELLSRHKKWYLMVPGLNTNYIWKSRKLAIFLLGWLKNFKIFELIAKE